jgi:amidophosphoribosyltransferase
MNSRFLYEEEDKLKDECGVFAAYNVESASYDCFLGLNALQHRGQEACGIVTYDPDKKSIFSVLGKGELSEVFIKNRVGNQEGTNFKESLPGKFAVGHVRYSTSGAKKDDGNIQPVFGKLKDGRNIVIAHNGNMIEFDHIKKRLIEDGAQFSTTMDTEVILHMIIQNKKENLIDKIRDTLKEIRGAYSLIIMVDDMIIGVRDQYGLRPLVLGQIKEKQSYFLSSETCALDIVGASFLKTIDGGEIIIIKDRNYTIFNLFEEKKPQRFCLFEYIYFLRPDSINDNLSVYQVRKNIGAQLAQETFDIDADVVIPVPDSGIPAAIGFSEKSGLKFEMGIVRNHYIGRTFLKPSNEKRNSDLHIKHNANKAVVEGKKIVIVDDSIVRGNTSRRIVKMLKEAGAKEVHMRVACPEIKFSCIYGIDTPDKNELISNKNNIEQLRDYLGLDSLAFLSLDGLYKAIKGEKRNNNQPQFCDACLTGDYFI